MKFFSSLLFGVTAILFLPHRSAAQIPGVFKDLKYQTEAGAILSSGASTPFWLRTNQYGEVPLEAQIFTLRGQLQKDYDSTNRFSYGYGARAVLNAGGRTQFLLPELYAKVRYGAFELYAGRRREIVGLVDSTLSSGSYIWSGNALPIPKIQLSIPNYTPILFKSKILSIKGQYSHGWFGSGDSTNNYYLHQSSFYARLGKPSWRFKLHGGFNHQAQWGGAPTVPFYDPNTKTTVSRFGNSFGNYVGIVLGVPIDYETRKIFNGTQIYGEGNRAGNHLGSVDLAVEYEGKAGRWLLYRQSIYEDGSLFFLSNISDGLSGLSWAAKGNGQGVRRVVLEYLQTTDQGGPYSAGQIGVINELRGQDNYFNNGVYNEGWVYRKQTIGTPFLMPLRNSTGISGDSQLAGKDPNIIVNNRVKAIMLSAQTRVRRVDLLTRLSYSQNLGSYPLKYNIDINQISLQQQVAFPVKQYTVATTLAYDGSGILKKNVGVMVLVKRNF